MLGSGKPSDWSILASCQRSSVIYVNEKANWLDQDQTVFKYVDSLQKDLPPGESFSSLLEQNKHDSSTSIWAIVVVGDFQIFLIAVDN